MLYMNSIVLKNVNLVGKQNGVAKLFSGPVQETKQACVYFAITVSTYLNLNRCFIDPSRRYTILYVPLKLEKSLRGLEEFMPQMNAIHCFSKISLYAYQILNAKISYNWWWFQSCRGHWKRLERRSIRNSPILPFCRVWSNEHLETIETWDSLSCQGISLQAIKQTIL